jgi:hypothetical protein
MKSLLTLAVILTTILSSFTASSQATNQISYLDQMFKDTADSSAVYIRTVEPINDDNFAAKVTTLDGQLKMKGQYVLQGQDLIENGTFTYYFTNGNIESEGQYDMGLKSGAWKRFTRDGNQRPDRFYNPKAHATIRSAMNGG